jgi:peptidoglycan/xylan/chitin deacetylase (PgdA/CDA1 family)
MASSFIISLDTELAWGFRFYPAAPLAKVLRDNEEKVISVIDAFLALFEKYSVAATWAVVGKLFYEQPEIVTRVRESSVQHEIGYHSFSHIRFSQVSRANAEMELKQGSQIQDEFGIRFRSFVYPENMIGHVDLLPEYGFSIYRGPNNAGANVNKILPIRVKNHILFRIIAPTVRPRWRDTIWEIPSSMKFGDDLVPYTTVFRAKQGIKKAIETGSTFHMFVHPEDALLRPELLDRLEKVLQLVETKAEKKELVPITMGDFAEALARNDLNTGPIEEHVRCD